MILLIQHYVLAINHMAKQPQPFSTIICRKESVCYTKDTPQVDNYKSWFLL